MGFIRKIKVLTPDVHARRAILGLLVAGLVLTAAFSVPRSVAATHNGAARACSERTLRGDYGLLASGVRLVSFGPHAGKTEMVIGTGLRTYDGAGGFTESGADLHGQLTGVSLDPGGISGTYQVELDCTGKSIRYVPGLPFAIVSNFVIVDHGREVKEATMEPAPNLVTVVLDRR